VALPYRNLVNAEEAGLDQVVSPCPACYSHLKHVHERIGKDPGLARRLQALTGKGYKGNVRSKHVLDLSKRMSAWTR